jgi:CHAT domain
MEWHDFPLEIASGGNGDRVRVLGPVPGGEMSPDDAEPVVVADGLATLVAKLERRKASQEQVFEIGRLLGAALLPGRVRELYEASLRALAEHDGLRIRLSVEVGDLAALPWEYAHVPRTTGEPQVSDFLTLRAGVSLVRHQVTGAPLATVTDKEGLRVVLAIAEPEDLDSLELSHDRKAVEDALTLVNGETNSVQLQIVRPATRTSLARALDGADVLHFAGHGGFGVTGFADDGSERTEGWIVLEDDEGKSDPLPGAELALMLAGAGTRLVVLGACQSAARDVHGPWSGVAPALIRNDLPAVVAMQFKVLDANASRFMAPFYAGVLGGRPVDEAVWDGRRAIVLAGGVAERDWAVPVLYLRTADAVLFRAPEEGTVGAGARSPILRVRQRIGVVAGEVTGGKATMLGPGAPDIDIEQEVRRVEKNAIVTGVSIDEIGRSSPRSREQ